MAADDFSFPRISETCSCNIDSPPLWNLSPATSPNPYKVARDENRELRGAEKDSFESRFIKIGQRKSFSHFGRGGQRFGEDDDEEEEKMDSLWEDFNEELSSTTTGSATSSSREAVELRCGPPLKLARNSNGALVSTKNKPSMVAVVKVLRKFFSLNNSPAKPRKRLR